MKNSLIALSLVAGSLVMALPAVAQEGVAESEVSVRALFSPDGSTTGLFGGAGISHRAGALYFGGAGYGGPVVSQPRGGMGYGGAILGASNAIAGGLDFDARLLVGGGGGSIGGNGAGSFALEPSIALGLALPGESKLSLTAGYLYMPRATQFNGATVGLRFLH